MHSDLGRTVPNLGEIMGCEVDIIALDVEVRKKNILYCDQPNVALGTCNGRVGN